MMLGKVPGPVSPPLPDDLREDIVYRYVCGFRTNRRNSQFKGRWRERPAKTTECETW